MFSVDRWVEALVALLLLAGATEMLLPSGAFKGYARALLGLLVLLGVLQPVVGLLRGNLRLDLPALTGLGQGNSGAAPAAAAAVAQAQHGYETLVAAQAARMAQQVPGVQAASATVRFAPAASGVPSLSAAAVAVAAQPGSVAAGAALEAEVQRAVAAGLDLPASAVQVSVW